MSRPAPRPGGTPTAARRPLLRRALAFAGPHRAAVAVIATLTLVVGATQAFEPLLYKVLFDALTEPDVTARIGELLLVLGGLVLARELTSGLANWITWRVRLRIHYRVLGQIVERLQQLPAAYHTKEGVGAVLTRIERSIQGFVGAVSEIIFNVLPAAAYFTVGAIAMVRLDVRLFVVVAVMAPLPAIVGALVSPQQVRRERKLLDRWTRIYARFHEVLSSLVTVRSFTREGAERRRFLARVNSANRVVEHGVRVDSVVSATQNLLVACARLVVIGVGAYLVARGEITAGTILAFLGYVGGLLSPVQALTGIYGTVRKASVAMEEVFSVLDQPDHVIEHADAIELQQVRGEVCFENVSFRYDDKLALTELDLVVAPGQHVAIVGPSGSGKTTMTALLQRFFDPCEGRVLVDGMDLVHLKRESLRRNVAVVLQDPVLFNDTVRANIAYGRPSARRPAIEAAARAANAHGFIEELAQGYDTVVGERGALLSMGQRQRIAIARALLKDAPIVVLDEATASLDAESEGAVQDALTQLVQGRTTLTIAHRLATVVGADRILVLEKGRIVEDGTHAELVAREGIYAALVKRQLRGLLPEAA